MDPTRCAPQASRQALLARNALLVDLNNTLNARNVALKGELSRLKALNPLKLLFRRLSGKL